MPPLPPRLRCALAPAPGRTCENGGDSRGVNVAVLGGCVTDATAGPDDADVAGERHWMELRTDKVQRGLRLKNILGFLADCGLSGILYT